MDVDAKQKVGFIGIGRMGQPMAGRLLDAGFPLIVLDKIKMKTNDLHKRGAEVADSPREVAAHSSVVITMTHDEADLEAVVLGENGVLAGARAGCTLINMSTVDPQNSKYVAGLAEERGVKMLRAPVSGSTNWAAEGLLTILVSGDKQAYERCQKILRVMGQKIFYLGTREEALYLKLSLNMIIGVTSQVLAEALTLSKKAGLDWNQMLEVIGNSVVASPVICRNLPLLAERKFTGFGTIGTIAKDFDAALAAGRELGSPMPLVALVRQFFGTLEATGKGEMNDMALILLMEELGGMTQRASGPSVSGTTGSLPDLPGRSHA